jgi:broad specificity phosphatase PhoE
LTHLILIRHGETQWNRTGRYQGHSDIPLNENGREQARHLAERLRTEPPQGIYASDLLRARETAEILGKATGAPVRLDPRLREVHQGLWEGRSLEEILATDGARWHARREDPLHVGPPQGESLTELRARLLEAVAEVRRSYPHGRVALVSHGLALATLKVHFLHLPIGEVWDHIPAHADPIEIPLVPL